MEKEENQVIAIHYTALKSENFYDVANALFNNIKDAIDKMPNYTRILYLDIEGHTDEDGKFDDDMQEIQEYFVLYYLMPYITEVVMPIGHFKNIGEQVDDIPDELKIVEEE